METTLIQEQEVSIGENVEKSKLAHPPLAGIENGTVSMRKKMRYLKNFRVSIFS